MTRRDKIESAVLAAILIVGLPASIIATQSF